MRTGSRRRSSNERFFALAFSCARSINAGRLSRREKWLQRRAAVTPVLLGPPPPPPPPRVRPASQAQADRTNRPRASATMSRGRRDDASACRGSVIRPGDGRNAGLRRIASENELLAGAEHDLCSGDSPPLDASIQAAAAFSRGAIVDCEQVQPPSISRWRI